MEGTMIQLIGNVVYTVHIKSSEQAKDNYETKFKKFIESEMYKSLKDEERKCL